VSRFRTYDGTEHPVTDGWYASTIAPFPDLVGLTESQVEADISSLLAASNNRSLSVTETDRLGALTRIRNVNKAWCWLEGRHYNEMGLANLDELHGNALTLACGCTVQYGFHHYKAQTNEDHAHHAHHPRRVCAAHAHLSSDFKAHFEAAISTARGG